jgi:predicted PurR-regulated permease PerM
MKREDGLSVLALAIIIVLLLVIIGAVGYKVWVTFNEVKDDATAYNKEEIAEKLNLMIKEKYVLDYKYASENNQNIDDFYNDEYVINYLIENKFIEQLKDIEDNPVQDQYYINAGQLNSDVSTEVINANGSKSNGTKLFKLKKVEEKYIICYVDKFGEEEELGELVLRPEV